MKDVEDRMYPNSRWLLKKKLKPATEFSKYYSVPSFSKTRSVFDDIDLVSNLEAILPQKLTNQEKSILISILPYRRGGISGINPNIINNLRQTY